MRKYEESKTTRIMMATVPHVTSGSGLRKFQAVGFLLDRVYIACIVGILIILHRPCYPVLPFCYYCLSHWHVHLV